MAMTPSLFTQSALAVETGLDRRTVASRLRHVPPRGKVGRHKAWHLSDVIGSVPAMADLEGMSVEEAKRRKLAAEAAMAELALAKEQGSVIDLEIVLDEVGRALDGCRARITGIGAKVAPLVARETSPAECKRLVDDVVNEALEELSGSRFSPTTQTTQDTTGEP